MNTKPKLFFKKFLCAVFAVSFICFCGCSKMAKIPDVSEYFSTELNVKSSDMANISVDKYEVSEIDGTKISELYILACYDGKLYLTQGAVAENNFEEAKVGRIIEYDLITKTTKIIVESTLPSLLPADEDSKETPDTDDLIFIDYRDMGFYDNKLFFVKTSSYALGGAFHEYYYYDTATGECELFFTPAASEKKRTFRMRYGRLAFLGDKVYFDDKYRDSAETYSSDMYSFDLKSKTASLETKSAEAPIAYDGKILCYCDDGFYTLDNEFAFSPNNSSFIDVSEVCGGSVLGFCNPVYDESGEYANGSAVGYYNPDSFDRSYILTSAAEALYFGDLVSAGNFIAWGVSDPAPIAFADVEQDDVIILSSDIAYSRSFVDDKSLNVVSFNLNNNGFPTFFTVYSIEL